LCCKRPNRCAGFGRRFWRLAARPHADCPLVAAALQVDFSSSKGRLVIDTEYGGAGTKDPMPVQVLEGLALVDPVADGARRLTVRIGALPPKARVIVGPLAGNKSPASLTKAAKSQCPCPRRIAMRPPTRVAQRFRSANL